MKTLKKTLCILISVLMLTAFMPVVAFAGVNQVTVDDDIVLNADTPYYADGAALSKGSLGKDGCSAYYDAKANTLYVQKYTGGSIFSDGDLTILVNGAEENLVKSDSNIGVYVKGDLTITGEGDEADFEVYAGPKGICADGNITISNIDYFVSFADETSVESGKSKDIIIKGNMHTAFFVRSDATPQSVAVNSNGGNINISSERVYVWAPSSSKGVSTENPDVPAVIKAETALGIMTAKDGVAVYPQTSSVEVLSGDFAGVVELNGQNEIKKYKESKKIIITVNNPKNDNGVYYAEYTGKTPEFDISAVDAETGEPIEMLRYAVYWYDEDYNLLDDPVTEIGKYNVYIIAGNDEYLGSIDFVFEIIAPAASNEYDFIKGNNGDWTKNEDGSIAFHINGDVNKFVGVKVDGQMVDESNYTVEDGSTIVTLKKSYLDTLSNAKHEITFLYTDGSCSTEFTVDSQKPATDSNKKSPNTGNEITFAIVALCGMGFGFALIGFSKKSRKLVD